ncbi:site-specific DNA-methyltransferase [Clostridium sp.]|uniref:site-specific DNA-methyltransferase n=1 Tax=Clostridium sp. TaxID=1506 RepID=UPI001A43C204|nr:site-specific DNA-methyltransferase [Clostridium sp.]MBK5239755.1 site-specific DNA-methyltransferase [Clostridium sp.]
MMNTESTNITKVHREHLLSIINSLKEDTNLNILNEDEKMNKINQLVELELAINDIKYKLNFEKHTERVDIELETKIPVFIEDKSREIVKDNDKPFNFLLEGDNFHSLKLLEKTHLGKIDIIYIDPPYNTLNKDFVYGDKMMDEKDGFKHSKWLSFMSERLEVAKELLRDEGVIFISIDDNEIAQLKLICDEILGEKNFITMFIRKTKTKANDAKHIAIVHEYLLVYGKDKSKINLNGKAKDLTKYTNPDNDVHGAWKNTDPTAKKGFYSFTIVNPFTNEEYHPSTGRFWAFPEYRVKEWVDKGKIVFPKVKGKRFIFKTYLNELKSTEQPYTSLDFSEDSSFINGGATKELKDLFNIDVFSYPKPVNYIKELLKLVNNPHGIVLDFFAGSGTTGHAVLELNKEDGGNRQFILCTNNENNICEEVTYQRLKKVIEGYTASKGKEIEGIPANLKYYKTDFVEKFSDDVDYDVVDELSEYIESLVQLENAVDISNETIRIIFDDEDADKLENDIKSGKKIRKIYIDSDVLLTTKQKYLIESNNIDLNIIPTYYFRKEIIC